MTLDVVRLHDLLRTARGRGASDLHVASDDGPVLRVDGRLVPLDHPPIPESALRAFLTAAFGEEAIARLDGCGAVDGAPARDAAAAPYRIHAYRHAGGLRLAIRLLAERVPALEELGLPAVVARFAALPSGLILFAGPTGSGKTTALSSLVDRINRTSSRMIVTIEEPVEYLHARRRSVVAQCEVGRDVADYAEALRGVMRADPDVIVVGELRDPHAIAAALTVAETGHLVYATVHTNDASHTVDRIVDAFPPSAQHDVRAQLAAALAGIVALRLVRRRDGGRVAAAEILVATDAVRALIRDGKTHQLRNAIVTGRQVGMQTLEAHLGELVLRGTIAPDEARAVAVRPLDVRDGDGGS